MKKITLITLLFCALFNYSSWAQTPSQTLVSHEWILKTLVVDGQNVPVPVDIVPIHPVFGTPMPTIPNEVILKFKHEPTAPGILLVKTNMPFCSSTGYFTVDNTSMQLDFSIGMPNPSITTSYDDNYDDFSSIYINDYVIPDYSSGTYTIIGNMLTLGNSTTYSIFEKGALSLNTVEMASLQIYPNPAVDILNISYKSTIESVEIIDITGKKVFKTAISSEQGIIDISILQAGVYILNIYTTDGMGSKKIIKK